MIKLLIFMLFAVSCNNSSENGPDYFLSESRDTVLNDSTIVTVNGGELRYVNFPNDALREEEINTDTLARKDSLMWLVRKVGEANLPKDYKLPQGSYSEIGAAIDCYRDSVNCSISPFSFVQKSYDTTIIPEFIQKKIHSSRTRTIRCD